VIDSDVFLKAEIVEQPCRSSLKAHHRHLSRKSAGFNESRHSSARNRAVTFSTVSAHSGPCWDQRQCLLRIDSTRSPSRRRMTATCTNWMIGVEGSRRRDHRARRHHVTRSQLFGRRDQRRLYLSTPPFSRMKVMASATRSPSSM
jgi:hypothetical protein